MDALRMPRWGRLALIAGAAWITALAVNVLAGSQLIASLSEHGAENVAALGAAGVVAWRAATVATERLAWALAALAIVAWAAGDAIWLFDYAGEAVVTTPNVADACYLLFPLLMGAAIALLFRSRTQRVSRAQWVDGLTAGLTIGALGAVLSAQAVLGMPDGHALEAATLLAYPVTDLLLLMGVVWALAARGWVLDRGFAAIGAGVACFWLADTMYLVEIATGSYALGHWLDAFWYAAFLAFGWAAWQPTVTVSDTTESVRAVVMPIVVALAALTLMILGHALSVNPLAFGLAAAALVAVNLRLVLAFAQNVSMLRHSRHEASTDPLTGLGNRRALVRALDASIALASERRPLTLALFDLDGFKLYNDTFGHPAGDALLQRLGANLMACVDGRAQAFRMGGDEFCVLFDGPAEQGAALAAAAAAVLGERGDGFEIGCSHGLAVLPRDADETSEALRLADQHLYAAKAGRRATAGRQTKDALLRVLEERSPDIAAHCAAVADLAERIARRLGLDEDACEHVRHAAELHDIGKIAVPDPILLKRGALEPHEWDYVRQHPAIGERIAAAAPALRRVARIIRSSHERWDGGGYPDRLTGDAAPIGARIIAVCDAYDAMVSERPYAAARTPREALAELRRCAGTQFDPEVVAAFCTDVAERGRFAAFRA
jgi:two-component system cell cycle response regulator